MSYVLVNGEWRWIVNATCINITELKDVTINTFIIQLISMILTIISTGMVCTVYWQPFCCCRKNKISPEDFSEAFREYIESQRNVAV
jgi:hypothetical protein